MPPGLRHVQEVVTIAPPSLRPAATHSSSPGKSRQPPSPRAVFQPDQMDTLVSGHRQQIRRSGQNNSQFKDKKVFLLSGNFFHDKLTAARGWRTEFLTQMGFTVSDLAEFAVDDHQAAIPDKVTDVLGSADILIWTTEKRFGQTALSLADPVIAGLPATRATATYSQLKRPRRGVAFSDPRCRIRWWPNNFHPLLSRALG